MAKLEAIDELGTLHELMEQALTVHSLDEMDLDLSCAEAPPFPRSDRLPPIGEEVTNFLRSGGRQPAETPLPTRGESAWDGLGLLKRALGPGWGIAHRCRTLPPQRRTWLT